MDAYSGKFENCPEIEMLMAAQGGRLIDLETKAVKIDGKQEARGIKLVFPFRFCKKKR